ncbi:hypothetical protein BGX38DRAFT_1150986, partial [Terfezia claveryi]
MYVCMYVFSPLPLCLYIASTHFLFFSYLDSFASYLDYLGVFFLMSLFLMSLFFASLDRFSVNICCWRF